MLRVFPIAAPDTVDLRVKRNPRARRLILRLSMQGNGIEIVAPKRASQREIAKFVQRNQGWISEKLAARPAHTPFAVGAKIPIAGLPHRIEILSSLRGQVQRGDGVLSLPCLPEHLPRRLRDYLVREARAALAASIGCHAAILGVEIPKLSLRDTTSRWGSCSSQGGLSFSWRLIMAPPDVLDYVAAHEMAHLRHMNHGPEFWALCHRLAPQTPHARAWLKSNGATLHRYG